MSDRRLELMIGRVLQTGVLVAAALAIAGGVMLVIRDGGSIASFTTFTGGPAALRDVGGIIASAAALDSRAVVQLGVLALIATPVARVALTVGVFAARRDWLYTAVTGIVLALLLGGLFLGR